MFRGWDSYYFMVGSAGAGLIGLFFVVVTLTQGFERDRALRGASLYMTPSLIHFAVVLSMSAVAVAPALPIPVTAGLFAVAALVGLGNAIWATVGIGFRRLGPEAPHWSDIWLYGAGALRHLRWAARRGGRARAAGGLGGLRQRRAAARAPAHRRSERLGYDHLDGAHARDAARLS